MREDNFFDDTGYPMIGLNLLGTMHAVNYVRLPFADRFDDINDSILSRDKHDILARDFTGYDFSAWVYDLVRPNEAYEERGTWTDGEGIRRPRKFADLDPEMKGFLREAGNAQYLNYITPFLIGINKLKIGEDRYFNFAMRSVPTSFGYYAGGDFFLERKHKMLLILGFNRSHSLTLPAVEFKLYDLKFGRQNRIEANMHTSFWLQPKNQMFYAQTATAGGMLSIQPSYRLSRWLSVLADFEYKTAGWLFANPYLDEQFSLRLGLKFNTI